MVLIGSYSHKYSWGCATCIFLFVCVKKFKKIIAELIIFRPHLDSDIVGGDALLVDGGDHALVVLVAVAEVSGRKSDLRHNK